ncbi:MAG: bifunctional aspartate kinase/homoserine dehydrogenase I [Rhizobacter sp.]|nr:bifunctional aspartate kinase/homoserine dehydrogenase I [Chlorobiales bacterium]
MKVLKFGGSSVGTPERIRGVIEIVAQICGDATAEPLMVVVSAFQGITNQLIETGDMAAIGNDRYKQKLQGIFERHTAAAQSLLHSENYAAAMTHLGLRFGELSDLLHGICLLRERSPKSADLILSFGERLSAYLISQAFAQSGHATRFVDTRDLIRTNRTYGNATVGFDESYARIQAWHRSLPSAEIIVATGFIASADDGTTTTLGRGGSDYTASIFGGALRASAIYIYTDVDGLMSADPRRVKDAFVLPEISYDEATELSHSGAKVLHPHTVVPAMEHDIPLFIKNTFKPHLAGTRVSRKGDRKSPRGSVKGISSVNDIVMMSVSGSGMIGVPGIAARLFGALAGAGVNLILIAQTSSEQSIDFAVEPKSAARAKVVIEKEFAAELDALKIEKISVREGLAIIAVIGEKMCGEASVSGKLFEALGKNGVNVLAMAQGTSEMNISVVVASGDEDKALNSIHEAFFLSHSKVHLFLIGTGVIAKSLLRQISEHKAALCDELNVEIHLNGIINTRRMLLDKNGVDLGVWPSSLDASPDRASLNSFVEQLKSMRLHNCIVVDCTASDDVAAIYPDLLASNISIVTPNKRANSSSTEFYQRLRTALRQSKAKFLYETNVGAGLPIIGTLGDLKKSGDKIEKIEGVLSGTLSYIFSRLRTGEAFSEIIAEAKAQGYTEPDPRDDLSGQDFARKFLILAREIGLEMRFEDIVFENLVPEDCRGEMNTDEFLEKLKSHDDAFRQRAAAAASQNKVLCYYGKIEHSSAEIGLREIDLEHPLASLAGTENMVVFTTERYKTAPLMVRGPGAGAEVTAGGVFADILRISNYLA